MGVPGAVLGLPVLTEAGTGVQDPRLETPISIPVEGVESDVDMVDEPSFKVPNKKKNVAISKGTKRLE